MMGGKNNTKKRGKLSGNEEGFVVSVPRVCYQVEWTNEFLQRNFDLIQTTTGFDC